MCVKPSLSTLRGHQQVLMYFRNLSETSKAEMGQAHKMGKCDFSTARQAFAALCICSIYWQLSVHKNDFLRQFQIHFKDIHFCQSVGTSISSQMVTGTYKWYVKTHSNWVTV